MSFNGLIAFTTTAVGVIYRVTGGIAFHRGFFVIAGLLIGLFLAVITMLRSSDQQRSMGARVRMCLFGLLVGLAVSCFTVMVSTIIHAADLRWLPANARHVSSIGAPKVPSGHSLPIIGDALGLLTNAVNGSLQSMAKGVNTALYPFQYTGLHLEAIVHAAPIIARYVLASAMSGLVLVVVLIVIRIRERQERRKDHAEIVRLRKRLDATIFQQRIMFCFLENRYGLNQNEVKEITAALERADEIKRKKSSHPITRR